MFINKKIKQIALKVITCAVIFCSINSAKAETLHFERGGASSAPGIVKKGHLNYEGGLFSYVDEFKGNSNRSFNFGTSLFRFGVHDRFEFRATNSGLILQDSLVGFDNLGLGFKTAIINEEHGIIPVLNLTTNFEIPIGREEFKNPGFNHSYIFTLGHGLPKNFSYVFQFGPSFVSIEKNRRKFTAVELPYIANLSYAVNDRLGIFTDTYGGIGLNKNLDTTISQDVGFAYVINDSFIIDASVNWGLNDDAPDFGIDAGFAVRLL